MDSLRDQSKPTGTAPPVITRILIVDDNRDLARSLDWLLQSRGYQTRVAHSGVETLRAALEFSPDLILLDLSLPVMNGYEVCRRLRANPDFAHVILCALTGWGTDADRARVLSSGFDHYKLKPLDPDTLDEFIASMASARR